ncbi:MAG TPA: DUF1565 domain-containing protein [Armatimonadota bacterium]|jgi:hypothetical protein
MKPYIRYSTAFAAMIALVAVPASMAATYYVATTGNDANPGTAASPFRNIQKGVNVAASGDSVLVAGGTYIEKVSWGSKSLSLAPSGSAAPVLDGGGAVTCMTLNNVPGTASIKGFTIQNGNGTLAYPYLGGGMALFHSSPAVSKCLFQSNQAGRGGGMYNEDSSPALTDCTFASNSVPLASTLPNGGAVYNDRTSLPHVNRCSFIGNYDADGGAGISTTGALVTATSCLFASNFGSAITNVSNALAVVTNCTFTGNGAYAIYNLNGGSDYRTTATVLNSIIWGNGGGILDDVIANGASFVNTSDIQGGFAGTGNINVDPQFIGGLNYRLQTTSPCVNKGNANAQNLPATDLDGAPRILGPAPDMGAYELWTAGTGAWFVDTSAGLDTNTGSPLAPFKTVVKAVGVAYAGNSVYVMQGNYGTDKPRITRFLHLRNWMNTGWARIGKP